MTRSDDLLAGLDAVRERIRVACEAAGRSPEDLTLIAISKTWPASDVALVHAHGLRDFGENKDQEASAKAADLAGSGGLRWHFIGQLQTNKARSVATYADVVHVLDRPKLARALSAGAEQAGRTLEVLVQVSLDGDPTRGGVRADGALGLADLAAGLPHLVVTGVMGVAPREADPRAAFDTLVGIGASIRVGHPAATVVSAGMSGDLEAAVAAGATHLRVGTALFGHRPPLLR